LEQHSDIWPEVSSQSALRLVEASPEYTPALEMLYYKWTNPLGAAAGGYLLLGTEADRTKKPWHEWIHNLSDRFPWLPDGAIQEAWLWLRQGSSAENLDRAYRALKIAYSRGLPYFSLGFQWMVDGLTLVGERNEEATELLRLVQRAAWRVNTSQPFTSIALARPFKSQGNPFKRELASGRGNAVKPAELAFAR
jgi:hypothetical protein